MKRYIKKIYLIWRRGKGERRIRIGEILKNQTQGIRFRYLKEGLSQAIDQGLQMYPDFPDPEAVYTKNVLDIFAQRLNNTDRADIQKYYDYWEIDPGMKDDKYYVLAQTQGLLSTDQFEFLAEYYPVKDLKFTSEICGLSSGKLPNGFLSEREVLDWKLEQHNRYDPFAVSLWKDGRKVGYVKAVHSTVFYKSKRKNLQVTVKSLEQNGYINRAFISVKTL